MTKELRNSKFSVIQRFLQDDKGTTAIEYGIIAVGIAVAIAGAVTLLGEGVSGKFNTVESLF